jgi:hypothetical protein
MPVIAPASALPWTLSNGGLYDARGFKVAHLGFVKGRGSSMHLTGEESVANAAYLLLVANAHPALVAVAGAAMKADNAALLDGHDLRQLRDAIAAVDRNHDHRAAAAERHALAACREALRDLLDQLHGIGIPDWHGAEGLSLEQSRAALAAADKEVT